jgi:MFS family permease
MVSQSRYGQMYAPLRIPNYRMFITGQTISTIGSLIQMTAQSWVVFELTRSPAALGWVALLGSLPLLILGPFAGTLADRVNRRLLLIGTQSLLAVLAALFAVLVQTGLLEVWHIFAIAFLTGIVVALDMPALQAFAADLTGPTLIRQAVTLNSMAFQTARTVGPSIAGLLLGLFGNATAFWVNAASFIAVIIALWRVRFSAGEGQSRPSAAAGGPAGVGGSNGGPREAIQYVFNHPAMLDLYLFMMLFTFLVFSTMTVYPAFVADTLNGDATVFGFFSGASGAGSLVSTLVVLPMVHAVRRTGLLVAGALTWFGVMLTIMTLAATTYAPTINTFGRWLGLTNPLPYAVAIFGFLQSMAGPIAMTTSMGLLQQMSPANMRARLLGLMSSISFGMQPFAGLLVGYSGEHLGAAAALRINGILLVLAAGSMVTLRSSVRAPSPATVGTMAGRPATPVADETRRADSLSGPQVERAASSAA